MKPVPSAFSPTRRRALTTFAGTLAAATLTQAQQPAMVDKPATAANKDRTAIHYEIDFKASPQRLYEAILDQKQFAAFTGMPATIDPTPGGAFSQFSGMIVGRNIELVPNQRIVQAWRPTHWDPGIYSITRFVFNPRGTETMLVFDHTGFPAGEYDHLDWGWHNHYWDPLKKFLA
ncbi:MAG: SRPBCC family protein [Terracidiphilus sp.]